jgi:hypothetical protein
LFVIAYGFAWLIMTLITIANLSSSSIGSMQEQLPGEKRHGHNMQKYALAARGCFILQSTA